MGQKPEISEPVSEPEELIIRPVPQKPAPFEKFLTRIIITTVILVILTTLFFLWYFFFKSKS
jgi:hypothetical protein